MKKKGRSFLDEFVRLKKVDGVCVKDRTKGFKYLHKKITVSMAEGKEFRFGDLDFSKFTEEDINEYFRYYDRYLDSVVSDGYSILRTIRDDLSLIPKRESRGAA